MTPPHIEDALRRGRTDGLGYLIWTKIDPICLARPDLASLLSLEEELRPGASRCRRKVAAAKASVRDTIATLKSRNITRIALGVSWCDWVCWKGGAAWIRWYLREFAAHFTILPRVTFTPPPLTDGGTINSPPVRLAAYAEFLDQFLIECGDMVEGYVELWNEFPLDTDWLSAKDPDYEKFMTMVALGTAVVHKHKKKAVLGGVPGVNERNISLLAHFAEHGLFRYIDVAGLHDLRGTWGDHTPSAPIKDQLAWIRGTLRTPPIKAMQLVAKVMEAAEDTPAPLRYDLRGYAGMLRHPDDTPPVWLTEYGFPVCADGTDRTERELEDIQVAIFANAAYAVACGQAERVYWYTYQDFIGESVRKHTTGWEDTLQWHYGDTCTKGHRRLLGRLLDEGGIPAVLRYAAAHALFRLVDAASLKRAHPDGYTRNVFAAE